MEHYFTRIPIFRRDNKLWGYRLIMSPSVRRSFIEAYREPGDADALYRLITLGSNPRDVGSPFLMMECSEDLLTTLIPFLPRNKVIVVYDPEGKEKDVIRSDVRVIRGMGYDLAALQREGDEPFPSPVNIVVREYNPVYDTEERARLLRISQQRRLARKVETRRDFKGAERAGYWYMEGMFFLEKDWDSAKDDMVSFAATFFRVMGELRRSEPSFKVLTDTISRDVNLTYKLLKFVNSAYYAPRFPVKTVAQAITTLGLRALNLFLSSVALDILRMPDNTEIIRASLIRAKFMELLTEVWGFKNMGPDAYFVGMFSLLDVLLNRPMKDIMQELPLSGDVQEALVNRAGPLGEMLEFTRAYERGDWQGVLAIRDLAPAVQDAVKDVYISALKWGSAFEE